MTQSEWAAWTQAILTVVTFAIALWRQETLQKRAEAKQDAANALLNAEKARFSEIKARALAIALESDLTDAKTVADVLVLRGPKDHPKDVFDNGAALLTLRTRGSEAVELGAAADPVLRAVHAARTMYEFLELRKDNTSFAPADATRFINLAEVLAGFVAEARSAVRVLLYGRE